MIVFSSNVLDNPNAGVVLRMCARARTLVHGADLARTDSTGLCLASMLQMANVGRHS